MASKEGKFGTFGGVFTPSILTILGVIMYLRLPWVVGNAGLYTSIGIIAVAHVISIATGLSISSIATDKSVGAGGPYYIVSRSLGLPIGGTLGLALFVGLAFSISLYVIGFSESFLSVFELDASVNSIRICGTIVIVALTVLTFISTALAIKTQYLILALIVLSLVSIFVGSPETVAAAPQLKPAPGGEPLPKLFGIFFPAVTGFTAGVNMSGDLENPKKSIPRGTMAAIVTGLFVYVGLAVFLSLRVPTDDLIDNPNILLDIAVFGQAVIAGIWGATLSSALGSILGAPRILQAVSADGITPRIFARGYGKTHEPRNALFLAFAIGEAGILIGELDAIARIVSMVFLATYGFLNISCAIESWASPDFRPAFRIPKSVSLIGAVTCVVIMIQLDLLAMLGATALMGGLFAYLQRRQLRLDSGDTWEGIWSSLVRSGLFRLSQVQRQKRNWRPNIVAFGTATPSSAGVGLSLLGGTGMLTEVELVRDRKKLAEPRRETADEPPPLGVFFRKVHAEDPFQAIPSICQYHGLAGLEANTVLLDYGAYGESPEQLADLLGTLATLDLNQLIFHEPGERTGAPSPRIDVWWRSGGGNLNLCLSLVRFLTTSGRYENTAVRFVLISEDPANNDILRTTTRRHLADSRIEATIRVVNNTVEARTPEEWAKQESGDAMLTLIGLPNDAKAGDTDFLRRVDRVIGDLGDVLLFRASSAFAEVLSAGRAASISLLPAAPGEPEGVELPPVAVPPIPDLARVVVDLVERYKALVLSFDEHCVARIYGSNIELIRRIKAAFEKNLDQLDRSFAKANERRKGQMLNRVQSSFLLEARQSLERFAKTELDEQQATMEGRIEAFLGDDAVSGDPGERLKVLRNKKDFEPADADTRYIRRFKRRRRWASVFRRDGVLYSVPVGPLKAYTFHSAVDSLLNRTVVAIVADSHQLAVHLGKILGSMKSSLALVAEELGEDDSGDAARERRNRASQAFDELIDYHKARVEEHRQRLLYDTSELCSRFASDLSKLDVHLLVKTDRKVPDSAQQLRSDLAEAPAAFRDNQAHLFERAELAVTLSGFHHRLLTLVTRQRDAVVLQIKNGTLSDFLEVRKELRRFLERLESAEDDSVERPRFNLEFKNRFDPGPVIDSLMAECGEVAAELPETVRTLSDEAIERLEEGKTEDADLVELSLRRLAQFLVETEVIAPMREQLEQVPEVERHATSITQDVVRLVRYQLSEFDALGAGAADEFVSHMVPVVKNGIERLDRELSALEAIGPRLVETVDRQLQAVIEGTNPYELTRASESLEQHIRLRQGKRAVIEAQGFVRRAVAIARGSMVSLLYRASAGVVLARTLRARASATGSVVDRVMRFVDESSPRPDVLDALPFYYRQLFLGQSLNDTFWVGRNDQMARARRALASFRGGARGFIVVAGERGSGKTAICQRLATTLFDKVPVYWVRPRGGGSIDEDDFKRSFEAAVGATGAWPEIFERLPDDSIVMIDDLELWWERSDAGLGVIDRLITLMSEQGRRCLFVLGVSKSTLVVLNKFRALADSALTVIECDPLPAESLGQIITLRHGSTGMTFALGGKSEGELSQWQLARLFSHHFNYSHGCVGAALTSWLTHIDKASDSSLTIRMPGGQNADALDELRIEWTALLIELLLHKQLTRMRLARITRLDPASLERNLAPLIRTGLVHEGRGHVLEVNRYVQHWVTARLERRGLVP